MIILVLVPYALMLIVLPRGLRAVPSEPFISLVVSDVAGIYSLAESHPSSRIACSFSEFSAKVHLVNMLIHRRLHVTSKAFAAREAQLSLRQLKRCTAALPALPARNRFSVPECQV